MHHEDLPVIGFTDDLTIEHLISQDKIDPEKCPAEIVGQIGNLILVDSDTNAKLDNNSFLEKKNILLEKGYKIPKEFSDKDELTPELIECRTQNVSKSARETIWKVT